jgi:glycosyltransferase involved in cell wall biosynthesis
VILVSHDSSGGVERVLSDRIAAITADGKRAITLRPVHDPESAGGFIPGLCRIGMEEEPGCANLIYRLPDELPALTRLLRGQRPELFEVHHRLGHHPSVMQLAGLLAVPTAYQLHDYAAFCPRITLFGREQRYCGEPAELAACVACVADAGDRTGEAIGVAELRARSAGEFAAARSIVVPSADMARRVSRQFPGVRAVVVPHEDDLGIQPPPPVPRGLPRRICVIGAISVEKGFDVLLACARDAAARDLPLSFVLVGHSTDDERLFDTGRVFVTGRYGEDDAERLIREQAAHLAFLPSIVPETWGFSLGLAWRSGLRASVFDIGAMAARVRATGHGVVMPLGLPAPSINQVLLTTLGKIDTVAAPILQHQGKTA